MAKAVLVMEMPESCSKCKFLYEFQGIKKCQLMNVLNNGASRLSQNTFTEKRHEKCPLLELPEKTSFFEEMQKEKDAGRFDGETGCEYANLVGKITGWNACLDAIAKE